MRAFLPPADPPRRDRARRTERGSAALEFALVLPVLGALLFGVITLGITYSRAVGLTDAVREGSRFAATADMTSPSWTADVIARVRTAEFGGVTSGRATSVCVQLVKFPASILQSACDAGDGSVTPALTMPALTASPAVPAGSSGFGTGQCVVRVYAARTYSVNAMLATYRGVRRRGSVARDERNSC
jgi:Flp pilus assembly protein TadG